MQFSACAPLLDVRGLGQGAAGLGTDDGDPDGTGWPIPGTLKPAPWALRPTAQVQLNLRDVARSERLWWDPRTILADVVSRCRADGIHPIVACELEFYVAFRIPVADAAAQRIEHRVAGADASPHLVMAAVLACYRSSPPASSTHSSGSSVPRCCLVIFRSAIYAPTRN